MSAFKIVTDKPIEKRRLGRPRHKWEDSIRMDIKETRNWVDSTQDIIIIIIIIIIML